METSKIASVTLIPLLAGVVIMTNCETAPQKSLPIEQDKEINEVDSGQLIFQSGFEPGSRIVPAGNSDDDIVGKDLSLAAKSDWVKDLDQSPDGGYFTFQYTGGDTTQRDIKIIPEPGNPSNNVLQFEIRDYWLASENAEKARIQANIYGLKNGYKEFYQSIRVFLSEDFTTLQNYPKKINWLTLAEFWNNEWWSRPGENNGFRITLGIGKPTNDPGLLNFTLEAEDEGFIKVWVAENHETKVPIGKWFTLEYYFKEGNASNGRFYMTITPDGEEEQLVYDVENFTHGTSDTNPHGVTEFNPMKLYTSKELVQYMKDNGKTLKVYWDDFKLWKNKQPAAH